jgi:hypothetical protein
VSLILEDEKVSAVCLLEFCRFEDAFVDNYDYASAYEPNRKLLLFLIYKVSRCSCDEQAVVYKSDTIYETQRCRTFHVTLASREGRSFCNLLKCASSISDMV